MTFHNLSRPYCRTCIQSLMHINWYQATYSQYFSIPVGTDDVLCIIISKSVCNAAQYQMYIWSTILIVPINFSIKMIPISLSKKRIPISLNINWFQEVYHINDNPKNSITLSVWNNVFALFTSFFCYILRLAAELSFNVMANANLLQSCFF